MQFAKLFDIADFIEPGQLLVELRESEERAEADAPFQLVLKTISPLGITMTLAYGYASEPKRDAEFASLQQEQAEAHYHRMQATMLTASE